MKTAMQELIDEMNEMLIDGNGSIYVLKEQARKLLKKEKEQIMDAYDAGQLHFWPDEFLQRGEYYYNETFNTNEK
jgi:uncharacterized coiled-coil protein SlyX